jgi:EAL domain-containing protein (putative c-di-GMP-specific phosphodiesterase class I)
VQPGDLQLEIIESTAIGDIKRATATLEACRAMGVKFALDDFGTGYSSLTYFRKLPIDELKVDQSFVRDMLNHPDDLGLVASVVHLAQAFNRPVIAEGVETEQHGELLVKLGCHLGQGYGIARPMPADLLDDWIAHWQGSAGWRFPAAG